MGPVRWAGVFGSGLGELSQQLRNGTNLKCNLKYVDTNCIYVRIIIYVGNSGLVWSGVVWCDLVWSGVVWCGLV